jgi:hypothetical protein
LIGESEERRREDRRAVKAFVSRDRRILVRGVH